MRYSDRILRCSEPNRFRDVEWQPVPDWRLPHRMIGCGHLVVDDTKLLLFGGRRSGGAFLDEIWMLDLAQSMWHRSSLSLPQRGKYRAHLLRHPATGQREVHLLRYGHRHSANSDHFVMPIPDLLNSMTAGFPISKWTEHRGDAVDDGKRAMTQSIERMAARLEEGGLSRNERKRLSKKLEGKRAKLRTRNSKSRVESVCPVGYNVYCEWTERESERICYVHCHRMHIPPSIWQFTFEDLM